MTRYLFAFFLLILLASCKDKSTAQPVLVQKNYSVDPEADSLAGKRYWGPDDYVNGVGIFRKRKEAEPSNFTDYILNGGNKLFNRIMDHTKYDSLVNPGQTKDEHFEAVNKVNNSINSLFKLYITERTKVSGKLKVGHEAITNFIALFYLQNMNIDFVNEVFPDKEKLDPTRKQGLNQMQEGLYKMLTGALMIIDNEYSEYSENDIVRLATFLKPYINKVSPFLNEEQAALVDKRVKNIENSGTYKEAKEIMLGK